MSVFFTRLMRSECRFNVFIKIMEVENTSGFHDDDRWRFLFCDYHLLLSVFQLIAIPQKAKSAGTRDTTREKKGRAATKIRKPTPTIIIINFVFISIS